MKFDRCLALHENVWLESVVSGRKQLHIDVHADTFQGFEHSAPPLEQVGDDPAHWPLRVPDPGGRIEQSDEDGALF
jgi:hypothetical protein